MEKIGFSNENLNNNEDTKVKNEENIQTPEQKRVVGDVINFINQHLLGIGLEQKEIDNYNVVFNEFQNDIVNGYYNYEKIGIEYHSSNNIGTLMHEMIHHLASDNFQETKNAERVKSGFSSTWFKKGNRGNFEALNEGITEKITREIISQHLDYVKKEAEKADFEEHLKNDHILNLMHKGKEIFDTEKYKETEEYKNGLIEIEKEINDELKRLNDIKNKKINYYKENGSVLILPEETNKRNLRLILLEESPELMILDENKKPILDKDIRLEVLKTEWEKNLNYQIEKFKENKIESYNNSYRLKNLVSNEYIYATEDSIKKRKEDLYKKLYEQPLRSESYKSEIDILNIIISGITYEMQKENPNIKEKDIWIEIQKAYFKGQTVWLRKIEKAFGQDTLRMIGELNPNEGEKKYSVLNFLSKKIEEIKSQ